MKIQRVKAREVLDSRAVPTVEVDVELESGVMGRAAVPAGASRGTHEALELRDGDPNRFGGLGVLQVVEKVNREIGPALEGLSALDQEEVDARMVELDGTPNRSKLGANAILGVSLAVARAAANSQNLSLYRYLGGEKAEILPVPLMNILNGGRHAPKSAPDFQEFLIVPAGAKSFSEALRMGVEVYQALKKLLKEKGKTVAVGDEGGFAPSLSTNQEAMDIVSSAVEAAGYRLKEDFFLALDPAASEFYQKGHYILEKEGLKLTSSELIDYYSHLTDNYPIISLEDGLAEDDWQGWKVMRQRLGMVQLVGDDLYATNWDRIARGIYLRASNSVLIKPNQVGTLTETQKAIEMAQKFGWTAIMSHRSGETEDTAISDLAVGFGTGQIKSGAPCRSERVAKYNRLLRIEEELGERAKFLGLSAFGSFRD